MPGNVTELPSLLAATVTNAAVGPGSENGGGVASTGSGPNNFAAFMQFFPILGAVEDEIVDKFRNGGGVPYSSYPRFHEIMAEFSGAIFDTTLVDAVLPMVPGVVDLLHAGVDVADVGTGRGHAINVMAKAFPK